MLFTKVLRFACASSASAANDAQSVVRSLILLHAKQSATVSVPVARQCSSNWKIYIFLKSASAHLLKFILHNSIRVRRSCKQTSVRQRTSKPLLEPEKPARVSKHQIISRTIRVCSRPVNVSAAMSPKSQSLSFSLPAAPG